jgi:hypothetical protein
MDPEKFKKFGGLLIKIIMAAALINIMWNVIVTQHFYFS